MVMVEVVVAGVPAAVTLDGLNVQVAPTGSPEQERAMVPLNPVEFTTAREVVPADPGALTFTYAWLEAGATKNPGVIVKVSDCVVLLG